MNEFRRNGSGYIDPTAAKALVNYEDEQRRHDELIQHIQYMCKLAGFKIQGRILLKCVKSGKVWK